MRDLKQRYDEYIARCKDSGKPLIGYPCPHCRVTIETLRAPDGEVWDTFSSCPHCDEIHFKITRGGEVEAHPV